MPHLVAALLPAFALALPAQFEEHCGPPVPVGGELVTPLAIARQLVETVGAEDLREAELVALAAWGRARFGEGDVASDLEVSRRERLLSRSYGEAELERVQVQSAGSREAWRRRAALEAGFDHVFLPLDAELVPAPTWDALRDEGADALVEDFRESCARGRHARELERDGREPWPDPLRPICREVVLEALLEGSADDLAPDQVRRLDPDRDGRFDAELATEHLFAALAPRLDASEVAAARAFLVALAATRQELARADLLIDEEEARRALAAIEGAWSPEQQAWLAELCRARSARLATYRVVESIRRAGVPPMSEREAARAFDLVDCDVLFSAAFDFERARWREDGWPRAASRSAELRALLPETLRTADDRASWDALLEAESELLDPPRRRDVGGGVHHGTSLDRGRFRRLHRDELARRLGETASWRIQGEPGVAARVFEEPGADVILGPLRTARGYALVRLVGRTPADERATSGPRGEQRAAEAALRLAVERELQAGAQAVRERR